MLPSILNEELQQDGHKVCCNLMCGAETDAMDDIPKDFAVSGGATMANTIASIHLLSCSPGVSVGFRTGMLSTTR